MRDCDVKLKMGRKMGEFSLTINGQEIPAVRKLAFLSDKPNGMPMLVLTVYPTTMEIDAKGVAVTKRTLCPKCQEVEEEKPE